MDRLKLEKVMKVPQGAPDLVGGVINSVNYEKDELSDMFDTMLKRAHGMGYVLKNVSPNEQKVVAKVDGFLPGDESGSDGDASHVFHVPKRVWQGFANIYPGSDLNEKMVDVLDGFLRRLEDGGREA